MSGTTTVTASASDNVGVAGVQFLLDGAALGAEDTSAPYSISWDTRTASNGTHTLSGRARDAAGNLGTSASVTVTVSNTAAPGLVAAYAFEELVAELGAAFLCAGLGIANEPRPDHAAYVASWLEILDRDTKAIFTAASRAQEALAYLANLAAERLSRA